MIIRHLLSFVENNCKKNDVKLHLKLELMENSEFTEFNNEIYHTSMHSIIYTSFSTYNQAVLSAYNGWLERYSNTNIIISGYILDIYIINSDKTYSSKLVENLKLDYQQNTNKHKSWFLLVWTKLKTLYNNLLSKLKKLWKI